MAKVVILGVQDFASLAHFYLKHDTPHEVVAFTVTRNYLPESQPLSACLWWSSKTWNLFFHPRSMNFSLPSPTST